MAKKKATRKKATKKKAAKKKATKKKAAKKKATKKKATKKKKRNVVLFVPPARERRMRQGLGEWVQDWPCAGGRASRAHWVRERLLPPLEEVWRHRLPQGARFPPVVTQDGFVYAADRGGALVVLNAATGRRVATLRTAPIGEGSPLWPLVEQGVVPRDRVPISSPPLVAGWLLLYGDDEGIFYSVRRGAYASNWRKASPLSLAARQAGAYTAPLEAGGNVYTVDADGNLYGVEPRNGTRVLSLYLRGRPTAPAAFAQGRLLVATTPAFPREPSRLHAIDPQGRRVWHRDLPGAPGPALVASRELVVVGGEFGLAAFDHAKGSVRWTLPAPGGQAVSANLALDLQRVYAAAGGVAFATSLDDGAAAWKSSSRLAGDVRGLTCAAGALWVAAGNCLHALDPAGGGELGRVRTPGEIAGAPVLGLGRMYVATQSGNVVAYAAE